MNKRVILLVPLMIATFLAAFVVATSHDSRVNAGNEVEVTPNNPQPTTQPSVETITNSAPNTQVEVTQNKPDPTPQPTPEKTNAPVINNPAPQNGGETTPNPCK